MKDFLSNSKNADKNLLLMGCIFLIFIISSAYGGGYYGKKEFQVNTYTTADQKLSSVAGLSNGNIVYVWQSTDQDGSYQGIFAQIFDATGTKVGSEFLVNTNTSNGQLRPSVAVLNNGNFVVTWDCKSPGYYTQTIYGQIFNATGAKVGDEFAVSSPETCHQYRSHVAVLSDDNVVVTWDGHPYGVLGCAPIHGQLLDGSGTKIGSEFIVNESNSYSPVDSSVAVLSDGNFVVTWSNEWDGDGYGVYGQIFYAIGTKVGSEFLVNTYTDYDQTKPSVVALNNGNFVVTWSSLSQHDYGYYSIYGQIFNGSGTKVGGEFSINTHAST